MIPPFLYHYTDRGALLQILKNKTIRFSRLDCLNDPLEGNHHKLKHLNKHIYASSWTSEAEESLPMWKMYSDLKGVRIKMPIDLFSFHDDIKITKSKNGCWSLVCELDKGYAIDVDMSGSFTGSTKGLFKTTKVYGPCRIEYVVNSDAISAHAVSINTKETSFELYEVDLNYLGLVKLNTWSFEKEYRYRIIFPDALFIAGSEHVLNSLQAVRNEYVDVGFNEKAIRPIEVLVGPMIKSEELKELDEQLKGLGVSYSLITSKIKIR